MLVSVQKLLASRLFSRRAGATTTAGIIQWWELRRIPYNLAVGAAGVFTLLVVAAVSAIAAKIWGEPLSLPDPPILALFAVAGYALGANVCFTGGWLVELLVRRVWKEKAGDFGPIMFALGTIFSVLLTLAPAAFFTGLLVVRSLLDRR